MSTDKDQAAFPGNPIDHGHWTEYPSGLTAREHAAIALRVPDSGNDWLDAMIRTAQRNELAGRAMQGLMGRVWEDPATGRVPSNVFEIWAKSSFSLADAMLSASAAHSAEGE